MTSAMWAGCRVRGGSWSGNSIASSSPWTRWREARATDAVDPDALGGDQAGGLGAGELQLVGEKAVDPLGGGGQHGEPERLGHGGP